MCLAADSDSRGSHVTSMVNREMFSFGPWQILILLFVVLIFFGNRLPQLARSFGQSIVEFKKGVKEIEEPGDEDQKS